MAKLGYIIVKKGEFMYTIVLNNEKNILLNATEYKQADDLIWFYNNQRKIVAVFNINKIVGFIENKEGAEP